MSFKIDIDPELLKRMKKLTSPENMAKALDDALKQWADDFSADVWRDAPPYYGNVPDHDMRPSMTIDVTAEHVEPRRIEASSDAEAEGGERG